MEAYDFYDVDDLSGDENQLPRVENNEIRQDFDEVFGDLENEDLPDENVDYDLDAEEVYRTPLAPPSYGRGFTTKDSAWAFLDFWTGKRGYGMRTRTAGKRNKHGDITAYYLECDRSDSRNHYSSTVSLKRKRKKGSQAYNCPFIMTLKVNKESGFWCIETTNNEHNHQPSSSMMSHPSIRRRYRIREARELIIE